MPLLTFSVCHVFGVRGVHEPPHANQQFWSPGEMSELKIKLCDLLICIYWRVMHMEKII